MASKKAGRLAGLAALGLAAYMNKDKLFGAKGETKAAASAPAPAPAPALAAKDTAAENNRIADARAAREEDKSTAFDRNTDTGVGVMPSGGGNAAMFEKEPGFETKTTPTTPLTFGQTFRQARNAGDKTFTFNGKKYTTELAKPAAPATVENNKRGGVIKKMASGGVTSSASKRGDGIATKGKTRGRMC